MDSDHSLLLLIPKDLIDLLLGNRLIECQALSLELAGLVDDANCLLKIILHFLVVRPQVLRVHVQFLDVLVEISCFPDACVMVRDLTSEAEVLFLEALLYVGEAVVDGVEQVLSFDFFGVVLDSEVLLFFWLLFEVITFIFVRREQ